MELIEEKKNELFEKKILQTDDYRINVRKIGKEKIVTFTPIKNIVYQPGIVYSNGDFLLNFLGLSFTPEKIPMIVDNIYAAQKTIEELKEYLTKNRL